MDESHGAPFCTLPPRPHVQGVGSFGQIVPHPGPSGPVPVVADVLQKSHIATHIDPQRGFDHGVFIPLKLMYPHAEIPTLQLPLVRGLNPVAHLALGTALRTLVPENLFVVGSGFQPMTPFKIG